MQVWQRLADAGELTDGPGRLHGPEQADRGAVRHLRPTPTRSTTWPADPEHREVLERLRAEHRRWQKEIIDLGLLPEPDLRTRFGDEPPYDAVRRDPSLYPLDRIAARPTWPTPATRSTSSSLLDRLDDADPAVRYWAAIGIGSARRPGRLGGSCRSWRPCSTTTARRSSASPPPMRSAAWDVPNGRSPTLAGILQEQRRNEFARLAAINILDRIDAAAARPSRCSTAPGGPERLRRPRRRACPRSVPRPLPPAVARRRRVNSPEPLAQTDGPGRSASLPSGWRGSRLRDPGHPHEMRFETLAASRAVPLRITRGRAARRPGTLRNRAGRRPVRGRGSRRRAGSPG